MDISFNCDKCGQHIVINEAGSGKLVKCPKCRTSLFVPSAPAQDAIPEETRPAPPARSAEPTLHPADSSVRIYNIKIPFGSVLTLVCQFTLAGIIVGALIGLVVLIVWAIVAATR